MTEASHRPKSDLWRRHRLWAVQVFAWNALKSWAPGFSAANYATATDVDVLENTTGAERDEIEAKLKGIENPWHEAWCVVGWLWGREGRWRAAATVRWPCCAARQCGAGAVDSNSSRAAPTSMAFVVAHCCCCAAG